MVANESRTAQGGALVSRSSAGAVIPTLLGGSAPRIPIAGRIRAGIKVLKRSAAQNAQARQIYEAGVAAGKSFEAIERELAKALPELEDPLTPKNVPYFTVRGEDFSNPEMAGQIMDSYGEDRGEGRHLYRFPVVFPADAWQLVMPHELVTWTASERRYWSEYSEDGQTRWCKTWAPPATSEVNGRALRVFGGRKTMLRRENGGLCDPERCPEYQARKCNLSGRFIFLIPGIKSLGAFDLPTNSFYAMQAAIEKFKTIGFMRGGRISGFLGVHGESFYLTKRLVEVSRLGEDGRPTRAAQWLIELEAPVDLTALLRQDEDAQVVEHTATEASDVLQGQGRSSDAEVEDVVDLAGETQAATTAAELVETIEEPAIAQAAVTNAGAQESPPRPPREARTRPAAAGAPAPDASEPMRADSRTERAAASEQECIERELAWIVEAADALGVDEQTFERYAAKRWGGGWKKNALGRKRALQEVESFQEEPEAFVAKVNAELEVWA